VGSKVFGTVPDLLDECVSDDQLAGFDVRVNRPDFTTITGG